MSDTKPATTVSLFAPHAPAATPISGGPASGWKSRKTILHSARFILPPEQREALLKTGCLEVRVKIETENDCGRTRSAPDSGEIEVLVD